MADRRPGVTLADYAVKIYVITCPNCSLEINVRGHVEAAGVLAGHKHLGIVATPTDQRRVRSRAK